MERLGIAAYGASPDPARKLPDGVKLALTWRARIVESKILPAGHGVSYGGTYKLSAPQRIGVLPVGYGDGFRRMEGNTVLVEGHERKILGRICMDHCMVDLDGFGDITGGEAILIGEQRGKVISADDVAKRWGTISYDVYTGIAARVARRVK
jgi:alanine racemase